MGTRLKFILVFLLLVALAGCREHVNTNDYLGKVLTNLEKIESATYDQYSESWEPGDTVPTAVYRRFIKEYNNPLDSTIGASFVSLDGDDTTKLDFCYDGNVKVIVYEDVKGILIDDFTVRKLPFRLVSPPFFNYTKNIIRYALSTGDSITMDLKDCGDNYYFKLVINEDKQVEFFGKAYHMPESPFSTEDPTSIYELWISKSNNLPYKVRREMSHNISVSVCSDLETNKLSMSGFNAYDYFPNDYEIRKYGDRRNADTVSPSELVGKSAPDWILKDINQQPVALSDLKSKVLLINFTGIGCGACRTAIPFLRELKDRFSAQDFEVVAIETWGRKTHSLQNYANKNKLNYKFLEGNEEVVKHYQTHAVPVFVILDEQRIIRNVLTGYGVGTTDKEIISAIKKLL